MNEENDLYIILNVKSDATSEEIKKSYKKLILKYHPDKNKDNKDYYKKKFIDIQQAFKILYDKEKRKQYDLKYFNLDKKFNKKNKSKRFC